MATASSQIDSPFMQSIQPCHSQRSQGQPGRSFCTARSMVRAFEVHQQQLRHRIQVLSCICRMTVESAVRFLKLYQSKIFLS